MPITFSVMSSLILKKMHYDWISIFGVYPEQKKHLNIQLAYESAMKYHILCLCSNTTMKHKKNYLCYKGYHGY